MMETYSDKQIIEARNELWRKGNLSWKNGPTQDKIETFINACKSRVIVLNLGRRSGKSFLLCLMGIAACLKKKKATVKMLQPEQKMCKININPIIEQIIEDCPPDLRPKFHTPDSCWYFPNGSRFQIVGTDKGNYKKLRGGDSDLCLVDEAGIVADDLGHIIRSVLLPTTLRTRGKIILSSTTPVDAEHEFLTYMEKAEAQDAMYSATLYDVLDDWEKSGHPEPLLTRELLQEIILEYPMGEDDEEFRRECLNELVTDGDRNIIPEFDKEAQEDIIAEWPRPVFCDKYVFMDIGFVDLTVSLFGYVDFDNAMLVIEDEIVMNGPKMTTPVLAQSIKDKEEELWRDPTTGEFFPPHLRVSDNNPIVLNDLQKLHGLYFRSSGKDDLFAAVNRTRTLIRQRQLIIHPRCTTLINHIKHGLWNKNKTKFNRTQGKNGHHYDALAALVIGIRNIDFTHNPYPPGYRRDIVSKTGDIYLNRQALHKYNKTPYSDFAELFKVKSSIGGVRKSGKINK